MREVSFVLSAVFAFSVLLCKLDDGRCYSAAAFTSEDIKKYQALLTQDSF
jgi:hypothetical protein